MEIKKQMQMVELLLNDDDDANDNENTDFSIS